MAIPRFQFVIRDPKVSCWNCAHGQRQVSYADPECYFPRAISCRRRALPEAVPMLCNELVNGGSQTWSGWFGITMTPGTDDDFIIWPLIPDGTLAWCSNWRHDTGTVPEPPPFVWPT